MKRERLTIRTEKGEVKLFSEEMCCGDDLVYRAISALCEYEDKIEQGTVIELPCKVGDTIYIPWIYDGVEGISFHKIVKFVIYPENVLIVFDVDTDVAALKYGYYNDGVINISSIGKRVFLTREEAEKRLKELQEEIKAQDARNRHYWGSEQ